MLILSFIGGWELPYEDLRTFGLTHGITHDAAAALVDNGKVVAAIEEERLSRIKHTAKAPTNAIKFCLDSYGVKLSDIDKLVVIGREENSTLLGLDNYILHDDVKHLEIWDYMVDHIQKNYGSKLQRENTCFVDHHIAHASSAYYMSGFDRSLIVTIDGSSPEGYAGYIVSADGDSFTILDRIPNANSLGVFYLSVIKYMGYFQYDEYKVMGLAPYGNPDKYRKIIKKMYNLLPEGKFKLNLEYCAVLFEFIKPRKRGEGFTQQHKDLAAALQEGLETIVLHILEYYRKITGHTRLCMSGGVAHNCSMNGKVLYSGLFDNIFVQPAAHDAGNTVGGALYIEKNLNPNVKLEKLKHLYWGTNIADSDGVHDILERWKKVISYRKEDNITGITAKLIADGNVIGWVQGRSEFGPRALGNRSILADPRKAENKNIINAMVKKREGYRPFAPSVLEGYLEEYYEVPQCKAQLSYMNFVLKTKKNKCEILGAVTHVDGSARVQTVSKEANEKYWRLIDEFRKLTGIPVLLNTSFNNNVEPIVDSEEDAIICFLTTDIQYLIIGDYVISKKDVTGTDYVDMVPKRLLNAEMKKTINYSDYDTPCTTNEIRLHYGDKYKASISEDVFTVMAGADGKKSLQVLFEENNIKDDDREKVMDEILKLWSLRLIALKPVY